jgi:protocatechuate 3,4-dioxygenase, alpha subunit
MSGPGTPSQTVGPFYSIGLDWLERTDLAEGASADSRVTVRGRVIDGDGKPVPDAVLEIWQADAQGRYAHPEGSADVAGAGKFFGFGRVPVNERGEFHFTTIKPGSVIDPDGAKQAPHLAVSIFMRGLLRRLVTRIYFPDEPLNQTDPVLAVVPAERHATLIAASNEADKHSLVWDVHLQGENETVFFDC